MMSCIIVNLEMALRNTFFAVPQEVSRPIQRFESTDTEEFTYFLKEMVKETNGSYT